MSIDTISYYIQRRLYPFIFGCKIYKDVLILPGTESNCLSAIGAGHIVFPTDEKNMLMSFIGLKRKVHARMSWLVFQHSILAYDDTITEEIYYRIYSEIGGFLSGKAGRGAVIYSLEPNPNGKVLQRMIRNGVANAAHYVGHSALTIIDSDLFYQPMDKYYSQTLANKLSSTVIELHNSHGYDKFLLFCGAEKFSKEGDFASNKIFEQQINSDFHSNIIKDRNHNTNEMTMKNNLSIEAICVYKKNILQARTLNELIKLVSYHTEALHYQEIRSHRALEEYRIVESIRRGFEEILWEGSSSLLFATLKLIYKIDESKIISDPDVFFEKLNKMIGRNAASIVIPRISQHIISEVLY